MSNSSADFETLLKLSGLKKYEFAKLIGVQPGTISHWKIAAPNYAIAYLQLYVDGIQTREELKAAHKLVGSFAQAKLVLKEAKEEADKLIAILGRLG